jgi:hypothetical protein
MEVESGLFPGVLPGGDWCQGWQQGLAWPHILELSGLLPVSLLTPWVSPPDRGRDLEGQRPGGHFPELACHVLEPHSSVCVSL